MCTEKQSVAAYFDRLAAGWDEANTYSDNTILQILDLADIRPAFTFWTWAAALGLDSRTTCAGALPVSLGWISLRG